MEVNGEINGELSPSPLREKVFFVDIDNCRTLSLPTVIPQINI
jgi:hypothetical protein